MGGKWGENEGRQRGQGGRRGEMAPKEGEMSVTIKESRGKTRMGEFLIIVKIPASKKKKKLKL